MRLEQADRTIVFVSPSVLDTPSKRRELPDARAERQQTGGTRKRRPSSERTTQRGAGRARRRRRPDGRRDSEPAAAAVCGLWFPEADTSPDADVFQPQGRAR